MLIRMLKGVLKAWEKWLNAQDPKEQKHPQQK